MSTERKDDFIMNQFFPINKSFIEEIQDSMNLTKDDIRKDYEELTQNENFHNGLPGLTWDIRFSKIQQIAIEHNLTFIRMDRGIWKAPLVFDEHDKILYVFTSTQNLEEVIKKIENGNRTHYLYLITLNCPEGEEQLELIQDEDDNTYRLREAKKILDDLIDKVKNVVVVHYSYSKNAALDGTLSIMDDTAHIKESIKIKTFLNSNGNNNNDYHTEQKQYNNTSDNDIQNKPVIIWNSEKKKKTEKKRND